MKYCSNCGNKVVAGSKFCNECGEMIEEKGERYLKIIKCTQCGAPINSLLSRCEACGAEFEWEETSKSLREFSQKLTNMESDKQRIALIKSFPIPNNKRDIMEYMLLASSNIGYTKEISKDEKECEEVWMVKFLQAYQKSKLIFVDKRDFSEIQRVYEITMARRENANSERNIKVFKGIILKNLGIVFGLVILFVSLIMGILGMNGSFFKLLAVIILIANACNLKKTNVSEMGYVLNFGSGFVLISLSFLLKNGSIVMIGGIAIIVICVKAYLGKLK